MSSKNLYFYQFIQNASFKSSPFANLHVDTLVLSLICMLVVLLIGRICVSQIKPEKSDGLFGAFGEMIYNFLLNLTKDQIKHDFKTYFPLIASIFLFVLAGNFIGIGPWKVFEHLSVWPKLVSGESYDLASPTTDINVTFGLAVISLITYFGAGIAKKGFHYLQHSFLSLMAPIEILDLIVRPSTLAMRLLIVITADEIMRSVFLKICPAVVPVGVMGFEVFVACIQAFVFALLTSVYIGLAVAEEH